ncbi:MAG: hypothetical protein ACP5NF_08400, partial [Thermoanaerobaculum sp.]
DEDQTQGFFAALGLSAPQPNLPSSEYIVSFYADPFFSEWVGDFIRLCTGATARNGIQDGYSKAEEGMTCGAPQSYLNCWARFVDHNGNPTFPPGPQPPGGCRDLNGDGDTNDPGECGADPWILVDCPCSKRPGDTQCMTCGIYCTPTPTAGCPWWCQY